MIQSAQVCLHRERPLAFIAFAYSVLLLVINAVRLISKLPFVTAHGWLAHPMGVLLCVFLVGMVFVLQCAAEKILAAVILSANALVVLIAQLPLDVQRSSLVPRGILVVLWAAAVVISAVILSQPRSLDVQPSA